MGCGDGENGVDWYVPTYQLISLLAPFNSKFLTLIDMLFLKLLLEQIGMITFVLVPLFGWVVQ